MLFYWEREPWHAMATPPRSFHQNCFRQVTDPTLSRVQETEAHSQEPQRSMVNSVATCLGPSVPDENSSLSEILCVRGQMCDWSSSSVS